jgi:hypothetical protein
MTTQPFYVKDHTTWNVGFGMWNVDEWNGGSDLDTLHRVWVRSTPEYCSDTQLSLGESDVDCGGPCPTRCQPDQACQTGDDCVTGLCRQNLCTLSSDCSLLLWADPAAKSGDYLVDLDGSGGLDPMMVSCDMDTDGGGWMLVLNYLHRGGTNPAPLVLTDKLPLRGAEVLGPDESGTPRWGHIGNALFAGLYVDEMRFTGLTTNHDRRMDFITADQACITYFGAGTGSDCSGIVSNHRTLPGHTAMLPQAMDMFAVDQGDIAMSYHAFYTGWHFHWVVDQNRWDMDDWANDFSNHTLHRVWVRAAPDHCVNGQPDPEEEGTDCGGPCPVPCARVDAGQPCSDHYQCVTGVCQAGTCSVVADCLQIITEQPDAQSGDYLIDPDGAGGLDPFFASCDMTTAGGGWTLVLDYLHMGGTAPLRDIRTVDLPLRGSNIMGTDESGTAFWGHAGNVLFALFSASEVRFDAISRGVNRYLHASTCLPNCLDYFATGTGSCTGLNAHYRLLAGHRANLPAAAGSYYADRGDEAMTFFPFYTGGAYHWGIYQVDANVRWEVDDYFPGAPNNTLHRIWVRSCPVMMTDDFEDGDMAGWSVLDEVGAGGGPSAWAVASGRLQQTSNISGGAGETRRGTIAFYDTPTALAWQDYRFTTDALCTDNDGIGVVFRYQDADNFYRLDLDNEWSQWRRLSVMKDGVETTVAVENGLGFTQNQNFPIEIEVRGNAITVFRNGRAMFGGTLYDESLDHGTVGLYSWGSTSVYFDNVTVLQPCR